MVHHIRIALVPPIPLVWEKRQAACVTCQDVAVVLISDNPFVFDNLGHLLFLSVTSPGPDIIP